LATHRRVLPLAVENNRLMVPWSTTTSEGGADPEFFRRPYAETAIRVRSLERESLKKIQHIPQHIRERAPGFTPTE
jgi:hypothetical protein